MNWIDIKNFNRPNESSEDAYLVICHNKEETEFGYHFGELIRGDLYVESWVMNHYGPGYFISHFCKLSPPNDK